MSIERQAKVGGYKCHFCHKKMKEQDSWSVRHPKFEPFAMTTMCGECKDTLIEAVKDEAIAAARKELMK